VPVYEKLIVAGFADDRVEKEYRTAYKESKGNEKGFDARLKELKEKAFGEKFAALKRAAVNQEIKAFTLPAMTGESVSLEKLHGKVVVLDFWATWCGPCKQSFPHLQKVYEKYRSQEDVAIYAVNTFERSSGDTRKTAVEKFIADNKYGFPVLFDSDVASSNGIQSIPTQFVIDKNGRIQFINVGFEGPQMVEELSRKIELLRSKEFYQ
jgi:thiol-disulfide isomerase/thioredoxin